MTAEEREIEHEEKKKRKDKEQRGGREAVFSEGRCNYCVETCLRACKFKIMTRTRNHSGESELEKESEATTG